MRAAGAAPAPARCSPAPTTSSWWSTCSADFCPGGALAGARRRRGGPGHQPPRSRSSAAGSTRVTGIRTITSASPTSPSSRTAPGRRTPCRAPPGAAWCDGLEMPMNAILVSKGDDPDLEEYSGFPGKRLDLAQFLRLRKVERVFIAGLAADYCVQAARRSTPGRRVHRLRDRGRGAGRRARHHRRRPSPTWRRPASSASVRTRSRIRESGRPRPTTSTATRCTMTTDNEAGNRPRGVPAGGPRRPRRLAALGPPRGPGAAHRLLPAHHDGRLLEDRPPRPARLLQLHLPRPAAPQRLRHHRRAGAVARPDREPALHRARTWTTWPAWAPSTTPSSTTSSPSSPRCTIHAVPEGTVVFPHEPVLQVEGPLIEAQLLETVVLNTLNYQTLIATKAARIRLACGERRPGGVRPAPGPGPRRRPERHAARPTSAGRTAPPTCWPARCSAYRCRAPTPTPG